MGLGLDVRLDEHDVCDIQTLLSIVCVSKDTFCYGSGVRRAKRRCVRGNKIQEIFPFFEVKSQCLPALVSVGFLKWYKCYTLNVRLAKSIVCLLNLVLYENIVCLRNWEMV